jgi:hypothetical protein
MAVKAGVVRSDLQTEDMAYLATVGFYRHEDGRLWYAVFPQRSDTLRQAEALVVKSAACIMDRDGDAEAIERYRRWLDIRPEGAP